MYAATGREPGLAGALGWIAGMVVSVAFWELSLVAMLFNAVASSSSRFTYVKPTMYQYWKTVQVLVNAITANLGISSLPAPPVNGSSPGSADSVSPDSIPSTWRGTKSGSDISINVFAVASRAQALQARWYLDLKQRYENGQYKSYSDTYSVVADIENRLKGLAGATGAGNDLSPSRTINTIDEYIKIFAQYPAYKPKTDEEQGEGGSLESAIAAAAGSADNNGVWDTIKGQWQSTVDTITDFFNDQSPALAETMLSELRDGSQWVSFRVANSADSVSESVSNSTETSGVMDIFNSISGKARELTFNLGGGR